MSDFEALVREHQAAVCATAYALLRDRAWSEEIAQEAFIVAWQKLPAQSSPPSLPGWICGIARNLARNAARKRREAPMSEHDPEPAEVATPLDVALSREHTDLASRALANLADDDRELVVLFYRCDESIATVADVLAIPEATARKRMQRTRERLRTALSAIESTLRASRPGPAFTVACVAALTAAHAADAATAATTRTPLPHALAIGAGALALVVVVLLTTGALTTPPTSRPVPAADRMQVAGEVAAPRDVGEAQPSRGVLQRITSAERTALLARIRARHTASATSARAPAPKVYDFADTNLAAPEAVDPPPPGPLDKRTLRYTIDRMRSMLVACAEPDAARGHLALQMRLAGDETGTAVESVTVTEDTPLAENTELVECIQTTLESLELPAMARAETWDVYYPVVF